MSVESKYDRRRFLGAAVMSMAGAELSMTGSADVQSDNENVAALPPIKPGTNTSFGPLKQIDAGLLNIGYAEVGPSSSPAVILLHGWPYDIHSYVDVAPLLASSGYRVIVPYLRGYGTTRFLSSDTIRNGQQSVFAVDVIALMNALKIKKAIVAGYDWGARTADLMAALWPERCKALVSSGYLIVNLTANQQPLPPKWHFDDATFDRTAAAFNNPDHISIVIHNYRWRLGLAKGEPRYDELEQRLFQGPDITVPTITIASDFDGAAADGTGYRNKFSGKYSHRILNGIGHDVPQEDAQAFAQAVIDVDGY